MPRHKDSRMGDTGPPTTIPKYTRREALALGAAAGFGLFCGGCGRVAKRPNFLVFLADSWRADHVGAQGYARAVTPAIDQFGAESYYFERCYSQCTWTKPSIASLFTGLMPSVHQAGLRPSDTRAEHPNAAQVLRPATPSLAELLGAAGYDTRWFLANPVLAKAPGFRRGMNQVVCTNPERPRDQAAALRRWLEDGPNEPFFAFVHVYDPHFPYVDKEGWFARLFGKAPLEAAAELPEPDRAFMHAYIGDYARLNAEHDGLVKPLGLGVPGIKLLKQLYDAEIRGVDRFFEELLGLLAPSGLLDRTVMAVTSDHGESFGERDLFYHGGLPLDPEIHVPLLVRLPGQRAGARVPQPVALYDLFPTFLQLAGAEIPEPTQAVPLFSARGHLTAPTDRAVMAESDMHRVDPASWVVALVRGGAKVLRLGETGVYHCFESAADPLELDDLFADEERRAELAPLRNALRMHRLENEQLARQFGPPEWEALEDENLEAIRALGYL